jgi:DNA-binding NarL/FixJ family response regulator
MDKIKLLFFEDDPVWMGIISDHMQSCDQISIIATANNKEDAIKLALSHEYDMIVSDMMLSPTNLDGIDIATEVLKHKQTKMIILTGLSQDEVIVESFAAGVLNFINKRNYKDVVDAVLALYQNRHAIHPDAVQSLIRDYQQLKQKEYDSLLTGTEKDILKMVQKGDSQQEIADQMFTALGTIKKHITNILKKMNVKSSKEAAEIAKKRKMID